MALKWAAFPHDSSPYQRSAAALKKEWAALHVGDAAALPKEAPLIEAWRAFHAGEFAQACEAGLAVVAAGNPQGYGVANLAQCIYANYLESAADKQIKLFQEVMTRAEAHQLAEPTNANAFYQYAYAAGRYSQQISIMKALAQGYGGKIKIALETALKLAPTHVHAHLAMGAYHAEIIDKVGSMVGKITYGASKDIAEKHFQAALKIAPNLPVANIEYANGLLLLLGSKGEDKASALYVKASEATPRDAMEALDIAFAKESLEDE